MSAPISQRLVASKLIWLSGRFTKYGCQPMPSGAADPDWLVTLSVSSSEPGAMRKVCDASKANGQEASARCSYDNMANRASLSSTSHGRCQPTPWMAWGSSALLRTSGWLVPCHCSVACAMRLAHEQGSK